MTDQLKADTVDDAEDHADHKPVGTILIMVLLLLTIVAMWVWVYSILIGRS
jgi:hypothetical protein